jgi:hypothetical protein
LVGVFIYPISQYSYNIKALEKLFLVDSQDENIVQIKSMTKKSNNKHKFKSNKITAPEELASSHVARNA